MSRSKIHSGRRYLLALLAPFFIQAQVADTVEVAGTPIAHDTLTSKATLLAPLFHNPPVAILNDRPFRMDLFVNFDPVEIESVTLMFRTDSTKNFKEILLKGEYGRYRYILPEEELKGQLAIEYYFLATLKDYRLFAYPKDSLDRLDPFIIDLVPPTKEFFQQQLYE